MRFISFGSGSSGNCYFIGDENYGILIDAGLSSRKTKKYLKEVGYDLSQIFGIFITHDHFDHIKSVGTLGEVHNIPVYSTEDILKGINKCYKITEKLYQSKRPIKIGEETVIKDFKITPFEVEHDSSQCVGYYIEFKGEKITIATDLGGINDIAKQYICAADHVVIEANYDEQMLINGRYHYSLKQRILGGCGHLANHVTMKFLAENFQPHWKNIFFCHLSQNNNTPDTVMCAAKTALQGKNINLAPLPRTRILDVKLGVRS